MWITPSTHVHKTPALADSGLYKKAPIGNCYQQSKLKWNFVGLSGNFRATQHLKPLSSPQAPLFGEYPVTADAKGRFLLPGAVLRMLPEATEFVLAHGLDDCLVLYPMPTWQRELARIHAHNQYQVLNRSFARLFQRGAQAVQPDANKRLLVPKHLAEAALPGHDWVLIGAYDRIELWAQPKYEAWLQAHAHLREQMATTVMTNSTPDASSSHVP